MTSLRQRLIVGILAGITVILAANGLAIYVIVGARLRSEMDQALASLARSTANRMVLELGRPEVDAGQVLLAGVELIPADSTDDAQETWDRLRALARHASAIRVGDMGPRGRRAASMLRLLGRRSVCVARLSEDRAASAAEVEALLHAARSDGLDVAVLGEAALASGAWTAADLVRLAGEVRARLPASVELAVCEPREVWLTNPDLVEAVDALHVLYAPFASGLAIEDAVSAVACWQDELLAAARGREVVACGVGWPWAGAPVGAAVPGEENALRFLTEFATWAQLNGVSYFYRTYPRGEPSAESAAAWSLLGREGTLRPQVPPALELALGSPGTPEIEVVSVPRRGAQGDLVGAVRNVGTLGHRVAVYIRSQGAWWNKPSFASPITSIRCDGTWTTDVTTGEGDEDADALTAFLVPAGYTPPFLEGARALPDELFAVALDVAEVTR